MNEHSKQLAEGGYDGLELAKPREPTIKIKYDFQFFGFLPFAWTSEVVETREVAGSGGQQFRFAYRQAEGPYQFFRHESEIRAAPADANSSIVQYNVHYDMTSEPVGNFIISLLLRAILRYRQGCLIEKYGGTTDVGV